MPNSLFTNKTLLITGGTGSFGNAVLNRFLKTVQEIYAYSRTLRRNRTICAWISGEDARCCGQDKFYIGDVRDLESCRGAMNGVDYIFHAAAHFPMRGASLPPFGHPFRRFASALPSSALRQWIRLDLSSRVSIRPDCSNRSTRLQCIDPFTGEE